LALSREEVKHIAELARLGVTEDDVSRLQSQLSGILDHFETLRAANTDGVPPTTQSLPLANVERPDRPAPSYPPEAILANAPQVDNGFIRVRRILE